MATNKQILTSAEAAELLGVGPYYVPDLMKRHGVTAVGTMPQEGRGRPSLTWRRSDVMDVRKTRDQRAKARNARRSESRA